MQLVLLSGGSGKRLWPLSNNARSKQFLPLLEKEDGGMESMVQRVVRQVKEADIDAEITLATNASQLDIITNQLGDAVSVVTEPERRDTFPAIALAASYLKLHKQCDDDEVVIIMPCDPFTETGYFRTIGKMAECVKKDVAELVLMGISPTYPSAKYGYVVPGQGADGEWLPVARFTEKPTVEVAKQLIEQKAFWNGGVFAFRLGYIMDIVRKHIQSESFEDTRSRYAEFPKISFDYEVAEKAHSVAVVPFSGEWKDLGTWNTLTDELHHTAIGNALLGPKCENTHVINELQYPIFVDGLKDVVVSACPDGILVCAKKETENIKKYVETLEHRPMYEERRWGTYRVIDDSTYDDGSHSLTKSITLQPGKNISYQQHHHRTEVWTFVEGEGIFVLDGEERHVKAGDTVVIPVEHWHAIKAVTRLTFIEVQMGNPLVEDDIVRKEWDWKD
ncbi:MAG: cupin domain-containing protein [Muribaculaceae bacterium]|nr:cupin domain-containing protein [Muribaculaceae bacterium]